MLTPPYIIGASVIGPLHIQRDIPCQDACLYEVLPDNTVIIAVCDGLGSALKSEIGARTASEAIIVDLKVSITSDINNNELSYIIKKAIDNARKSLEAKSAEIQCELCDLACTVIAVIVKEGAAIAAHIGDGAVVAKSCGGLELISQPGDSEYTNEVVPLTSKNWEESLRISPVFTDVESIAVFTDGCQRAAFYKTENGKKPFNRFFNPVFAYAEELTDMDQGNQEITSLLASQKMSESSEDDKTLVIAVIKKGEETIGSNESA
jgi:hypothetical protein